MTTHAYARATDPETSWEAAESITVDRLSASRQAVWQVLADVGPCTDEELVAAYQSVAEGGCAPPQTPSGIRSRRSELVGVRLAADTGRKAKLSTGRRAIVWAAQ